MRVLIVDDSIHKIDDLSKYINDIYPLTLIDTAESISNALQIINEKEFVYNLIVIDQYLPIRNGEIPTPDGGQKLLFEINRTLNSKIPNYVLGFSQYDDSDINFSNIWKVITYKPDTSDWKDSFLEILKHISNTKFIEKPLEIIPTVFLEGLTDKFYLTEAMKIYFPDKLEKLNFVSQKCAGANWVASQLVVWSHTMSKNESGDYIKCIGLFDNDEAGKKAKTSLETKIISENQKKTCKAFLLKPKYNNDILEFYKKGCQIEIEIESLFNREILELANSKNLLEYRNPTFIENPKDWKQHEITSIDYIKMQEIKIDNLIYLKKVKKIKKEDFQKIIFQEKENSDLMINFRFLLEDILTELNI